jgi:hypothetical protein
MYKSAFCGLIVTFNIHFSSLNLDGKPRIEDNLMIKIIGSSKLVVILFLLMTSISGLSAGSVTTKSQAERTHGPSADTIYIPLVFNPSGISNLPATRKVNVPYFNGSVSFGQAAIFWFGKVTPDTNYTDVRIAYTQNELYVYMAVFDRLLWYDPAHTANNLTKWDSASLYLSLNGNTGNAPPSSAYRFDAQYNWWETPRSAWQAAFQGNGTDWTPASIPFTTVAGWKGNAPNDTIDDRGWAMTYHIPFTSLSLTSPPNQNTIWGLGVVLHDRDTQAGPPNPDQVWPETFQSKSPSTWGQLGFSLPVYIPPATTNQQSIVIRNKLNGLQVSDSMVGGGAICGGALQDFWNTWGTTNFAGTTDFNIQNQSDIADWPCFSKYYVTFPISSLPQGKVIVSASLTLHEFGNAGAPGQATPSWIQVMMVGQDWDEATLTWNNAPLASENYGGAWVEPFTGPLVWPGDPYTWDVSQAVTRAYADRQPLRLVLYSADSDYHSGKYFVSSDTEDWNAAGRPTLQITIGDAVK